MDDGDGAAIDSAYFDHFQVPYGGAYIGDVGPEGQKKASKAAAATKTRTLSSLIAKAYRCSTSTATSNASARNAGRPARGTRLPIVSGKTWTETDRKILREAVYEWWGEVHPAGNRKPTESEFHKLKSAKVWDLLLAKCQRNEKFRRGAQGLQKMVKKILNEDDIDRMNPVASASNGATHLP
ncbi:hypothetical protein FRC01_000470 [Tulasnella sp. 417]|nr:hypothetical protein FRC01_000470 [Tulasnella sp. 417]